MDNEWVNKVVNAVLYEGYLLYPYRPGSRKNQSRFTFGRVYPEAYSASQRGAEPFTMQTECLLEAHLEAPALEATVRFLQPVASESGAGPETRGCVEPAAESPVERIVHPSLQEAAEQQVTVRVESLPTLVGDQAVTLFTFPASRTVSPLPGQSNDGAAVVVRRQEGLSGAVTVTAEQVAGGVFKIGVVITNLTPVPPADLDSQDAVLMRTFASTHTILHAPAGGFLSAIDPPAKYAAAVASCRNAGTWPVLIGKKGENDVMLSSPIILYDYPEIAPESPGDLFDGTEIDEILTLRIMTMTDKEKNEARHADAFARRILDRTEALNQDHLWKMHGIMRGRNNELNQ